VGAGPAGLAASHALTEAHVAHVVLERGERLGHTWHNLYDSLVLHTGRHLSSLPGLAFPRRTPLFVPRLVFLDYLERYAEAFRLPIETRANVTSVERRGDSWTVRTGDSRAFESSALVVATGIASNPRLPDIPGRAHFAGRVIHSVEYRRPDGVSGRRVLVVGAGNSAGEISVELARHGARVTVAVQSGANIVPRALLGVPIQYVAVLLNPLPRTMVDRVAAAVSALRGPRALPPPPRADCPRVPLIGLGLADALRAGTIQWRGGPQAFTADGVRFVDGTEERFDEVILATGYRAALGFLGDLIRTDRCGFGSRRDGVISLDQRGLFFIGHTYDTRGAIFNIGRDAKRMSREVAQLLRGAP
jgi:cation diffusion facilitator CzcD-associated flavoprotein CzcO